MGFSILKKADMKNHYKMFLNSIRKKKVSYFCNTNGMHSFSIRNRLGRLHRVGAPAYFIFTKRKNGSYKIVEEQWRINGFYHRVDGPAYTVEGMVKEWWYEGERHRTDGPAIESLTPYLYYHDVWFIRGKEYPNEEEWFKALTGEEQVAYLFKLNR